MHVRYTTETIGNTVVAKVDLDKGAAAPVSVNEDQKLRQFGQLQVDLGGVLAPGGEISNLTLPTRLVSVPAELPVQQVFSLDDYPTAAGAYAEAWNVMVQLHISTALTTLMAKTPSNTEGTSVLPL